MNKKKISKTQSKLHQIKTILQFINEINVLGIKKADHINVERKQKNILR